MSILNHIYFIFICQNIFFILYLIGEYYKDKRYSENLFCISSRQFDILRNQIVITNELNKKGEKDGK